MLTISLPNELLVDVLLKTEVKVNVNKEAGKYMDVKYNHSYMSDYDFFIVKEITKYSVDMIFKTEDNRRPEARTLMSKIFVAKYLENTLEVK